MQYKWLSAKENLKILLLSNSVEIRSGAVFVLQATKTKECFMSAFSIPCKRFEADRTRVYLHQIIQAMIWKTSIRTNFFIAVLRKRRTII